MKQEKIINQIYTLLKDEVIKCLNRFEFTNKQIEALDLNEDIKMESYVLYYMLKKEKTDMNTNLFNIIHKTAISFVISNVEVFINGDIPETV